VLGLATGLSTLVSCDAFLSVSPASSASRTQLKSSLDDDELSKLIGKRSQIKRKKKEELPKEEDFLEKLDTDNIDMDNLPEFQTKRVKREPKKKEEDEESKAPVSNEPTYVDYFADYEDENEFHIPNRMGISTRAWGDVNAGFVPSGKLKKQQLREGKFVPGDLQVAYNDLMNAGILLYESSPEYGSAMASKQLSAEDILSRCISEYQDSDAIPLIVGTYPNKMWQRGAKGVTNALSNSCDRISAIDVYQIKNLGWLPSAGLVKGMTEAVVDLGTVNYVGVKNVSPVRLRRMVSKFDKEGIQVTTNAFDFSLTNRKNEKWIQSCKTLGVIPLITDPLGGGLASGQYTASNPSGGIAGASAKFPFSTLEKLQPLHSVLETVAERVKTRVTRELRDLKERSRGRYGPEPKINTDITTTQIALNYVVAKGGVPLAEVNSPKQAEEVLGCLGWVLNDEEVSMLDAAAELCK